MRYLIIGCIIFNYTCGYTQAYKEKFKADICNCLSTEVESRRQIRNAFDACFNKNLPTYATLIDASVEEETPALKYQKGQLLRVELKRAFLSELVYSCDLYFQEIESERQRQLATGRSRTYASDLEKLNQAVAMQPLPQAYIQRAKTHFFLGNLKDAEADLRKSLEVNPYGQQGVYSRKEKLLLAWVLEEQKRYAEAVTLYEESYAGNFDFDVLMLRAVAHKKAGGTQTKALPSKPTTTKPLDATSKERNNIQSKERYRRRSRSDDKKTRNDSRSSDNTQKTNKVKNTDSESLRDLFKTKKTKTKKDND